MDNRTQPKRHRRVSSCQFHRLVATCQQFATDLSILSSCNKSVKIRLVATDNKPFVLYVCMHGEYNIYDGVDDNEQKHTIKSLLLDSYLHECFRRQRWNVGNHRSLKLSRIANGILAMSLNTKRYPWTLK